MELVCAGNEQRLILSCVWNEVTGGTIYTQFKSIFTDFAYLIVCICMFTSQALIHLNESFSANVQLHVSALPNRAVIKDTFCHRFLDLFRPILFIIIVSVFIVKEALSAHFAASFIACGTILPKVIPAISAFDFGRIIWV